MPLTVLLGGARSGKSSAAQALAEELSRPVTYLATATAGDDEMAQRIAHHRRERPVAWTTIEEPLQLGGAISGVVDADTIVIDCLTLWLTNLIGAGEAEPAILDIAANVAESAAKRRGETIAVTNEVGLGLVPRNALARHFRDVAGRVNRIWVDRSHRSGFVIAGRILPLTRTQDWKEPANDR